jgi:class 3 adenylate cyclase/tetratricopeptide (TPR) repeat protein
MLVAPEGYSEPAMTGDLASWLSDIGLGHHAERFAADSIGWDVLPDLTEPDLRELGLPLGDRKRLLKAIAGLAGAGPAAISGGDRDSTAGAEAERRQIAVMFVDMVDSTPLAERLDPEDMRQVLRRFHEVCGAEIGAHDGHIARYMGDGVLVYFGYPQAHEDDAVRAVRAGLGIIAAMRAANDGLEAEHGVRLRLRIGIETGLVVAGEVGTGAARDSQAIVGETPNLAARLQGMAQADTIVIGPTTERLLQGSFALEPLGARTLKGVSEPVPMFRVLAESPSADRFALRALRGLTPLVGRVAELDMLRQRWAQSRDGEMRCVLLVGDPGIGKSRMLRAFRESIAADAHEAVALHCSAHNRHSPLRPVLQWLQREMRREAALSGSGDLDRVEAAVAGLGLDQAEAVPVLATLLGLPVADRYGPIDASSPTFKRRMLDILVGMIDAVARRQPLLLLVEDAHWIDPSTLEFLRAVIERLQSARLLMLVTARPEFKPDWNHPQLVQVNLDRLSRRERVSMIERLAGGKQLPDFVLEQIVARTDGIPLFIEELTKTVLQGDMLRDVGSRYELRGPLQAVSIPDTLQGSLLARLDRLPAAAKEVAQIAATIGREFRRDLLVLIAGKPLADLDVALEILVAAEIVQPVTGPAHDNDAYLFRHALIQEAAYQSLLLARRRHFHRTIAEALETHYPHVVEQRPDLMAQNLTAAQSHEQAIEYWRRAAELALSRAAYHEANAHAQRGEQIADSLGGGNQDRAGRVLPLMLVRGRAEQMSGSPQSLKTFHRVAQMARAARMPSSFVHAALGFQVSEELILNTPGEASIALLKEALQVVGQADSIDRSRVLGQLGRALILTGAHDEAAEVIGEAIPVARRLNDAYGLFQVHLYELFHVGARPLAAGEFPARRQLMKELYETGERLVGSDATWQAAAHALAACLEIGDLAGFRSALERYGEAALATPQFTSRFMWASLTAMQAILHGDFAVAETEAGRALQVAEDAGAEFGAGVYGLQMFTIRREQGRLAEVAPLVKQFVDEHPEDATWRPGLMLIASDLGFIAQARRTLEWMAEFDFSIPMDNKRLITLTYLAEVGARLGEQDHIERLYALLLPYADQAVVVPASTLCIGAAGRYVGMLAAARRDWPAMERHFTQALAMDEALQAWPWLAHTRYEYARALLERDATGDRARAAELLAAATATAEKLGMTALMDRMRALGDATRHQLAAHG